MTRYRHIARKEAVPVPALPLAALLLLTGMIFPLIAEVGGGAISRSSSPSSTSPQSPASPWQRPRDLSSFQQLLKHSPFSLPTAEESSPLAERYAMTGIITIDGEEQIFLFDRTDQSRDLITKIPNSKNISLVSLVREGGSAPIKASIRVGSESGTIGFIESAQSKGGPAPAPIPGSVAAGIGAAGAAVGPQPGVTMPVLPPLPQQPSAPPPTRRIIRRPIVTAPQAQPATP